MSEAKCRLCKRKRVERECRWFCQDCRDGAAMRAMGVTIELNLGWAPGSSARPLHGHQPWVTDYLRQGTL
jgi:hypothetical protein